MATSAAWPRFLAAQRWQAVLGYPGEAHHILVTERAENRFEDWPVIVEPRGEANGLFNLSAMRNQIRLWAQRRGYPAFMILESDFIALRWPSKFPARWAIPNAIYDNPGATTFQEITDDHVTLFTQPRAWEILGHRPLIPVHCVIVSKAVYHEAVWDERFEGCGYDDWDFNNNMTAKVGPYEHTDAVLVHRWHQSTGLKPRSENYDLLTSKWGPVFPRYV